MTINKQKPRHRQWWETGVFYEIYPRSFMDTTGSGVGDLQGIIDRLDYLTDLGVDALWISPFFPSPMKDFGYDVADYCNVDPLFGTLETFDRLLAEVHRRDMKMIIDWVPNHTSDEHPWFIESRSRIDHPKRDWYIWRDPKPDGSPPNNWGGFFGGPAWTFDEQTRQYYMHQFAPSQPELNWRNPEVKKAMLDTLRFWLNRGVDGFRMDVIFLIIKNKQLRDNPLNPDAPADLHEKDLLGRLQQIHNLDQDDVHPVLREIRQVLDEYDDRVAIGELWGPIERWVKYYGESNDELHLPFNFRLINQPWRAPNMRQSVNELESSLLDFSWPNYVLGNHDVPRLASRFGGQPQARTAAMMLLTLRGTPTLYYGDELGIEDGVIPPEKFQDPRGVNLGAKRNRDTCRTPMQWDAGKNAGFSIAKPWLPVSEDYARRNVASMLDDPHSILNLYRELLTLRKNTPALHYGEYIPLNILPDDCFIYRRKTDDTDCVIALNFTGSEKIFSLSGTDPAFLLLSTNLDRKGKLSLQDILLRPYEGLIIRMNSMQ